MKRFRIRDIIQGRDPIVIDNRTKKVPVENPTLKGYKNIMLHVSFV